jgi:hypothetical protein
MNTPDDAPVDPATAADEQLWQAERDLESNMRAPSVEHSGAAQAHAQMAQVHALLPVAAAIDRLTEAITHPAM